jgi:hypothetical protein
MIIIEDDNVHTLTVTCGDRNSALAISGLLYDERIEARVLTTIDTEARRFIIEAFTMKRMGVISAIGKLPRQYSIEFRNK